MSRSISVPDARGALYRLIALGFHYPTPGMFRIFQNGEFLNELRDILKSLPHNKSLIEEHAGSAGKVADEMEGANFGDFETGFVKTFEVGSPAPPCPLYEGSYRTEEPRTSIMLEVSEFYRFFGLAVSLKEGRRELPDHLIPEFEFLYFLTMMEGRARKDGDTKLLKSYLLAQKDFLERHLVRWIPKFSEQVRIKSSSPFYGELARITSKFIQHDLGFAGENLQEQLP
ncbi:MAG TPA: molecular chaperone TorD family protein [Candidatus Methanoperedens sp.]